MAAKKYYAVKVGKKTGIFYSWEECKASVEGFPKAQYKGFATMEEARDYMRDKDVTPQKPANVLLTYVDGSYSDALKKYAFGCVFLTSDGKIYTAYGNGDNPQSLQHRNVTGEMLGAMYAVKCAMFNGYPAVEIRYDYEGIEKWVTGVWRSKTELTQKYAQAMQQWGKDIQILFTKVAAHSNVKYNELADQLAKTGLEKGEGVPKVKKIEDMQVYEEYTEG